ncbi:MAG: ABC transporter permease [Gemmatimonadetes bacterium]|nr:ABC transporter permease [Gemmatimonadota bacterium]
MTPSYDWPPRAGLRMSRLLVRAASHIVPHPRRSDWIEEWEAELWHLASRNPRTPIRSLIGFIRGVIPHAVWERKRFHRLRPIKQTRPDMSTFVQDIRFAVRTFIRNPSFTLVVVITMALGIGASTTIFSVVNGVLLRPLPYPDSDRLVVVAGTLEGRQGRFPTGPIFPTVFAEWQESNTVFDPMVAVSEWTLDLVGEGDPRRLNAAGVSVGFLPMLRVSPVVGRNFAVEEDLPAAGPVAIVSYRLWHSHWGGDPDILGKRITLSGKPYTVVGVLPRDFRYPEALNFDLVDILYPYQLNIPTQDLIHALARLRDGVSLSQAQDAMNAIENASAQRRGLRSNLIPLTAHTIGDVGPRLKLLLGAVGFLLLIASANVANLLLARATSRTREIALRSALGASRARIARQLLTESLFLSIVGGAVGVGVAAAAIQVLVAVDPGNLPRLTEVSIDGTVLGFTLLITLATGVIFGAVPAAQLANIRGISLAGNDARATTTRVGRQVRATLVVAQVALALMLLIGASLLIESFVRLQNVDPGFDPTDVSFASIILNDRYETSEKQLVFFSSVLDRVQQTVPGLVSAGVVTALPMSGDRWRAPIAIEGYTPPEGTRLGMDFAQVSEDYFTTIGARVVAGRVFTTQDRTSNGPTSLVVNEAFARQYWPDGNALGRRLKIGRSVDGPGPWITVVGIVADMNQRGLAEASEPETYLFYHQIPSDQMRIVVRSSAEFSLVSQSMRRAVWDIDSNIPVEVVALRDQVAGTITGPRFYTTLLLSFAALALVLAAVGIYGTMSYVVGERRREMGIRIALGAAATSVTGLVVRQGLLLAALGMVVGIGGAAVATRLLESFLFGVTTTDPLAFVLGVVVLGGVAIVASYIPARRATLVDPVQTLRAE